MSATKPLFDPACRSCQRIRAHLGRVRALRPGCHCGPVPAFGDPAARMLIVGLAPGLHGANATGRPFTGDASGELLFRVLHGCGLASRAYSEHPDDGLELYGCRITNAVKCLPPGNRPNTGEIKRCNRYLAPELDALDAGGVVLALGTVAHEAVLRARGQRLNAHAFAHGAEHHLPGTTLVDSYHCSRYKIGRAHV